MLSSLLQQRSHRLRLQRISQRRQGWCKLVYRCVRLFGSKGTILCSGPPLRDSQRQGFNSEQHRYAIIPQTSSTILIMIHASLPGSYFGMMRRYGVGIADSSDMTELGWLPSQLKFNISKLLREMCIGIHDQSPIYGSIEAKNEVCITREVEARSKIAVQGIETSSR